MSIYDIWPYFEGQDRILNVKIRKSALDECQDRILNVKIRYSTSVGMSK